MTGYLNGLMGIRKIVVYVHLVLLPLNELMDVDISSVQSVANMSAGDARELLLTLLQNVMIIWRDVVVEIWVYFTDDKVCCLFILFIKFECLHTVSYTHLTLPTKA